MYYFGYNNKYDGRLINMDIYEFNDFVPRISFVKSLKNIDNKYILSHVINKDFDYFKLLEFGELSSIKRSDGRRDQSQRYG